MAKVIKRCLSVQEKARYAPYFSWQVLEQTRVVEGKVPFWLSKRMVAVVLGCCIYLRQDVYCPNSAQGIELLAHELTHVEQFLSGMTVLQYLWASRKGYRNNLFEREAYAKAAQIRCELCEAAE